MQTLRASQEHSLLCSLPLQKQSHRPGLKIFMIRMTEKNRAPTSAKPRTVHRKKSFSLEKWKGLWQTRDLLKLLRKRRNILYREEHFVQQHTWSCSYQFLGGSSSVGVFSLEPSSCSCCQPLEQGIQMHKASTCLI